MTTMTSYGQWRGDFRDDMEEALGDYAGHYDLNGLETALRDALGEELGQCGISLNGNEFIGPVTLTEGQSTALERLWSDYDTGTDATIPTLANVMVSSWFWDVASDFDISADNALKGIY